MRSRILPAVGVSALALVAAAAFAPGASASHSLGSPAHKTPAGQLMHYKANPSATCYNQADNDNGVGIVSQNFEASFDQYDAAGADDFKIRAGGCKIRSVHVDGAYFNGYGPATSETVTFYKGKARPGAVIKSLTKTGADNGGTFDIKLGKKGPKLDKGHYWISVVVNMDFGSGGEWGWNTNNTVRGKVAQWRNPGDGFATGCTNWSALTTCIPSGEGGDFSFSLGA